MQRLITSIILLSLTVIAQCYTVEEIPNVHIADRSRFLSNPDGIISPAAQTQADSIISDVWKTTTAELAGVVVNSIGDSDPDQFATELFSKWGLGKKDRDNGVLLLVVKDTRKIVIRTGYGAEGVIPDIIAGRIIREQMAPEFRNGDYDTGVIAALTSINKLLTDPEAAQELLSEYANDSNTRSDESLTDILPTLLRWGCVVLVLMLVIIFISMRSVKNKPRQERFRVINNLYIGSMAATAAGFGLPVAAFLIMRYIRSRERNRAPLCDRCGAPMRRVNGPQAVQFMSPQQQTEARIGSRTFDVWRCLNDGHTIVMPYPGRINGFTVCPVCGACACKVTSRQTVHAPSHYRSGEGVETSTCMHCGNTTRRRYSIAKLAAPIIVAGGFGRGGGSGFGGGGFSGGSFGGGMTGGGGASGGW